MELSLLIIVISIIALLLSIIVVWTIHGIIVMITELRIAREYIRKHSDNDNM